MRCQSGSGWTESETRARRGRPVLGHGRCVVAVHWCRPHLSGQRGQISTPHPPTLSHVLTRLCLASLFCSRARRANHSIAPSSPHLRRARTPLPPCHCAIACAHRSAITSSTSPTTHCLNLSQGKGLRAIAVIAPLLRAPLPCMPPWLCMLGFLLHVLLGVRVRLELGLARGKSLRPIPASSE